MVFFAIVSRFRSAFAVFLKLKEALVRCWSTKFSYHYSELNLSSSQCVISVNLRLKSSFKQRSSRKVGIITAWAKAYDTWFTYLNQNLTLSDVRKSRELLDVFFQFFVGFTPSFVTGNSANSSSSSAKWNFFGLKSMLFLLQWVIFSILCQNALSVESF